MRIVGWELRGVGKLLRIVNHSCSGRRCDGCSAFNFGLPNPIPSGWFDATHKEFDAGSRGNNYFIPGGNTVEFGSDVNHDVCGVYVKTKTVRASCGRRAGVGD